MVTKTNPQQRTGTFGIHVHTGNVLWELAHAHKSAEDVIVELVQNAVDEGATRILISINKAKETLLAFDDGYGTTFQEMQNLWSNVGTSTKRGRADKIGQKGIAKLAGLSIAEEYNFTTRPLKIKGSGYFTMKLKKSELRENEAPKMGFVHEEPGFGVNHEYVKFKATTRVLLKGLSSSAIRELQDIQEIADTVGEKFATAIRRRNVVIQILFSANREEPQRVQAKAREFPGTKQKVETIKTTFGDVDIELYTTIQPVKSPKLIVECNNWPFDLQNMRGLWKDARAILGSGHFQGYFRINWGNLVSDRSRMAEDELYDALAEAILTYQEESLILYLEELKDTSRFKKYADIIRGTVEQLDKFFKEHPQLSLQGRLHQLVGLVSSNHTAASAGERTPERFRTLPTIAEVRERRKTQNQDRKHSSPTQERTKLPHSSVKHPSGRPRHLIQGQFGLTVTYEEATEKTGFKWRTRIQGGILIFNLSHEDWIRADTAGTKTLQEYVQLHIVKELTALSEDNANVREHFLKVFENSFLQYFTPFM
ncbi:MAG: ATP-binding protein [Patescibacteria group bacterium]|jgi:hypothetical protein